MQKKERNNNLNRKTARPVTGDFVLKSEKKIIFFKKSADYSFLKSYHFNRKAETKALNKLLSRDCEKQNTARKNK